MYNVTDRLMHMLNISHGSLFNLKQELTATMEDRNASKRTLRSRTATVEDETEFPRAKSSNRSGRSGRSNIILSEYRKDILRYEFHVLLSEKQYPTLRRSLTRLKKDLPEFLINSITILSKHLKELGFVYRRTASVKTILDSTYFIAERARYFHRLNELEEEDNAKWHNKRTEFSRILSRAWNKDRIRDWLEQHQIPYPDHYFKAELLELCHTNAPPKQYLVDDAAALCDVEILRLPIKHCMLNPIEIAWVCMKNYIRDQNTSFKVQDIRELAANWLAACDESTSTGFFEKTKEYETTFKLADHYVESIETTLLDTDDDESDIHLDEDDSRNSSDDK
ncbi:unnamed protein product [Rotaria sp. Silwood1]|nr:unnamed protein product [Rotaria sp. Silwood1]